MDAQRWARAQAILEAALAAPTERRSDVIEAECAGDDALRADVERLVAAAADVDGFAARLSAQLGVPGLGDGSALDRRWIGASDAIAW